MGDENSLPDEVRPYFSLIQACPVAESEMGKICYLTVTEGMVEAGSTQRRGGVHTDAPGTFALKGSFSVGVESTWGGCGPHSDDQFSGGMFIASNLSNTTTVYNCIIETLNGVADKHGSVEHLRHLLGEPITCAGNHLYWLTDRTPHEALPHTVRGYRQFFRLVMSDLSFWYTEHNTPNPLVPTLPDSVQIISESKFDMNQRSRPPRR